MTVWLTTPGGGQAEMDWVPAQICNRMDPPQPTLCDGSKPYPWNEKQTCHPRLTG